MTSFDDRFPNEEPRPDVLAEPLLDARRSAQAALRGGWDTTSELAVLWENAASTAQETTRALPSWKPQNGTIVRRWSFISAVSAIAGAAVIFAVFSVFGVHGIPMTRPHFYKSGVGQRSTIQLADGSIATLAPSTVLAVTPSAIDVSGEAYFSVSPHAGHPFVVRTKNSLVQVLGTRFAVRQYANETSSQIMVTDGKVSLRAVRSVAMHDVPTVVSARMLARVTDSGVTVTPNVAVNEYIAWTHGLLVFNNIRLRDVLPALVREYGTSIQVDDTVLANEQMTMEVSLTEQSLPQVLELIGKATNAHYTRRDETYVLLPGRGSSSPTSASPTRRLPRQFQPVEKDYGK